MTISQRIFNIMESKNLKQRDLANYIGVANSSVSDWKNKGSTPSADKIVKISEFLNVSTDYLLGCNEKLNEYNINTGDIRGNHNANMNIDLSNQMKLSEMSTELLKRFEDLSFDDKIDVFNYIKSKKNNSAYN